MQAQKNYYWQSSVVQDIPVPALGVIGSALDLSWPVYMRMCGIQDLHATMCEVHTIQVILLALTGCLD